MRKPLPELILPDAKKTWIKIPSISSGAVDIPKRILYVPFGNKEEEKAIKIHEYAHIKWSPENTPNTGDDYLDLSIRAFEDHRVDCLSLRSGLKEIRNVPVDGRLFESEDPFVKALTYVIISIKENRNQLQDQIDLSPLERSIIGDLVLRLEGELTYTTAKECGKILADMYRPPPEKEGPHNKEEESGEEGGKTAEGISGRMTIEDNRDQVSSKRSILKKKKTDFGMYFKNPERILTDKMIFEEKRKTPLIGTILIDCSGSMSINMDELKKIVEEFNGPLIAGYSASFHEGTLHILAKDGKIVNKLPYFPLCNVIDLPALQWLKTQKTPRVWVSDGVVTGVNDNIYDEINSACFNECRDGKVIQVENLQKLNELVKSGKILKFKK